MPTSPLALPLAARYPRVNSCPPITDTFGGEAAELAQRAGLVVDPWQRDSLDAMLSFRPGGKWSCFEYAEILSRQNGKGTILEVRVLAGFILLGEATIIWTAHQYKTALELFLRVKYLIRNLIKAGRINAADIKEINSHGEQGFERLSTGQRVKFLARSKDSGRGFSGDLVIVDEAYAYTPAMQEALLPTMSARANPQIVYASSPPLTGDTGEVLYALRERGEAAQPDPSLCWRDWGLAGDLDDLDDLDLDDMGLALASNPALGSRLTLEFTGKERRAMSREGYARERLGIWPRRITAEGGVIDAELWQALADPESRRDGAPVFAVDVTPGRDRASIAVAAPRADGLMHWEVVEHRPGTAWLLPRLLALCGRHKPMAVAIDGRGPAASLIPALLRAGMAEPALPDRPAHGDLAVSNGQDMADAFGMFVDATREERARHRDQSVLNVALASAKTRPLGDGGEAWGRRGVADISPLVAVTLAHWAYETRAHLLTEDAPPNLW